MTTLAPAPPTYGESVAFEDELAAACGVLNAATAQVIGLVARALTEGFWEQVGVMSPEHYVGWQCGFAPVRARQCVSVARRWNELPASVDLFRKGQLSFDQMTTICRYCPAAKDVEVSEFAINATVPQLRRTLARYAFDSEAKPAAVETRSCSFGGTERDSWRLHAELPVDEGARVEATMHAIHNELFNAATAEERRDLSWADVLLEMSDRASGRAPVRSFRDRHRVIIHIDLDDADEFVGRLHVGSPLADWARRYLACDGVVSPLLEKHGLPVSFGRQVHIVPDRLRLVIEDRDGGCRVPGCSRQTLLHVPPHRPLGGPGADRRSEPGKS